MPRFSGDVREYSIFRDDFKHAIESRYSKRDAMTYLRACLQGKPLELIKGIGTDYDGGMAVFRLNLWRPQICVGPSNPGSVKILTPERRRRLTIL